MEDYFLPKKRTRWNAALDDEILLIEATNANFKNWKSIARKMNKSISQVYLRFSKLVLEEIYGQNTTVSYNFNKLRSEYIELPLPKNTELHVALAVKRYNSNWEKIARRCNLSTESLVPILDKLQEKKILYDFFIHKTSLTIDGYESYFNVKFDRQTGDFNYERPFIFEEYFENLLKIKACTEKLIKIVHR